MNVIQLCADTFRRDHLGCYGNPWIKTPYLDRFASRSVVFDRAYISSFPTVPTRFEYFTGLVAFTHHGWEPMPRNQVTIAERAAEKGCVSMMICDTPHHLRQGFYYNKGFTAWEWIRGQESDEWRTDPEEVDLGGPPEKLRSGWEYNLPRHRRNTADRQYERDYFCARTMQTACDWLERNHTLRDFWLYVDTFDPHEPWDAPEWYLRLYEKHWEGDRLDYPANGPRDDLALTDAEVRHIHHLYCAEVTLVDKWVGRLLEKIEDLWLLENTVVIFSTDHGGRHGEHGIMLKGWAMHEEVCHIPLIVHHPKAKPRRTRAIVQHPDVAATVLDALGAPGLDELDGRSFLPVVRGETNRARPFAAYAPKLTTYPGPHSAMGITDGTWNLAFWVGDQPSELYHIPSDPQEKKNVLRQEPEQARRLLGKFIAYAKQHGAPEDCLDVLRAKLAALAA